MITIKKFTFNNFQVNTLVLHDETGEAVIIDPACNSAAEYSVLKEYIAGQKLSPTLIANTHGHVDHIVGVDYLMKWYNIPFTIHYDDLFLVQTAKEMGSIFGFEFEKNPVPAYFLKDDDILKVGLAGLKILHVPGHSPGSVVFYTRQENIAIAGDVLFRGSIGRTDLPGGDYETLIRGIKEKLLTLPGNTRIISGHGPDTTIQAEHDTNPFLI